ncbi:alkaline phosphatase family protein [Brachybacterium sp. GCM10030268]|uniref:alkaline phosphatase family protein n=1 Tax=Brachybacterium sp. GCM10030268 TaxID=3273382 RepID=UPI003612F7F1
MPAGRTLVLAVDGLDEHDIGALTDGTGPIAAATPLRIRPGGPSEPAPALTSLVTGASVAHTGVATQAPFRPDRPDRRSIWYAEAVTAPTLLETAQELGLVTAALQWPATAGASLDLCLPLVEDLGRFRNRWEMTEQTSSPRMVAEHLRARREAGVQLSQVPPDELVAEIAAECCHGGRLDLLAARLTGLGIERRSSGLETPATARALVDTVDAIARIVDAFAPDEDDRMVLVPGRPLVPTALLVHPNAVLAAQGLAETEGTQLAGFRALVWPDGPRGVLHVRREEGPVVRDAAIGALREISEHTRLQLREVDDGVGATTETDVIAVLEGTPGTVFGLSATHRPLVEGDDPYYAGPRAVSDPSAPVTALAAGPGLPSSPAAGSWADLGVTLARALGAPLPGATAHGMCPA